MKNATMQVYGDKKMIKLAAQTIFISNMYYSLMDLNLFIPN